MAKVPAHKPLVSYETTTQQMSFSLFEEALSNGTSIAESPHEIGYRRHRALVNLSDLSIAARKAAYAAFFIVAQTPGVQNAYRVDLGYWKWLMAYTSGNRNHLRGLIRDLQKAALIADGSEELAENWGSLPLLGTAVINNGYLEFRMDERLQSLLMDPRNGPFLSLRITSGFSSVHAAALFDRLLNYVELGETDWIDLDTLRLWLDVVGKYPVWGVLKRDALEPAVKMINKVTPYKVEYDTRTVPKTKMKDRIKFRIVYAAEPDQVQLAMQDTTQIYYTLRHEFGLSPRNVQEILENRSEWSDDRLRQAMDYTRMALTRNKITKSVSGFFMHALRENLIVGKAELEVNSQLGLLKLELSDQDKTVTPDKAEDNIRASSNVRANEEINEDVARGLAAFDDMDDVARATYVREFGSTQTARLIAKKEKIEIESLTESVVRTNVLLATAFGQFMYNKLRLTLRTKD
jgi:hypothetical protein